MSKVAALLNEVESGCKVGLIKNEEAQEFVEGLIALHRDKRKVFVTRAAEILKEVWDIEIARRRLSDHIRGECGCLKT